MPARGFEDYDALPEIIRGAISRTEYAWLSDAEKQRLVDDMTMPEHDAEDPPDG